MSKRVYSGDKKRAEIALGRLLATPRAERDNTPVDASRARITVAPVFVDRRFAADPDHVGEFARDWAARRKA